MHCYPTHALTHHFQLLMLATCQFLSVLTVDTVTCLQEAGTQVTLDGLIRTQHARAVPGNKDSVHVTFVSLPIRTILVEEVKYDLKRSSKPLIFR